MRQAPGSARQTDPWDEWVARLREALESVERQLAEGRAPQWTDPEPPGGPVPDRVREQLVGLTARFETAQAQTSHLRGELLGKLTALPRSRPRGPIDSYTALGGGLDVVG
ncbi:MAG: hypothetical protein QG608_1557 [Actinomycetota bacterium]|nr:hypothetical protein [Actinomycetota bacterium]